MRSHRVLDLINFAGSVRSSRGGLLVDEQKVPLEDVAVILIGSQTTISGGAIEMLSKYDVTLLNCSWNGVPNYVGYTWSSSSRVAARHRAQAEATTATRNKAWKEIIQAKIDGQRANLVGVNGAAVTRLTVLRDSVRTGDHENNEAQAARVYWQAMFGDQEFTRSPDSDDNINSMLNYGYTVLRGFTIQAISAAGLWPSYGLWHKNRSNQFVLADDLIEPFRPALDHTVLLLGPDTSLAEPDTKRALVDVVKQPFNEDGQSTMTQIHNAASKLAQVLEGDRKELDLATWSPTQ